MTMAAFVESGGLDQVLDQMVEGMAFDQFATELGFGVSKRLIDGRIADIPAFAGVSGSFDQTAFKTFLRQNGMTEAQLRRDLRQQLLIEQIAAPIASMPRLASGMAQPYAALLLEQRRGQATFIPASPFAPPPTLATPRSRPTSPRMPPKSPCPNAVPSLVHNSAPFTPSFAWK